MAQTRPPRTALQQVLGSQRAIGFLQVDERLFGVRRNFRRRVGLAHARYAKHIEEDQHAVIGGDGASALGGLRLLA
jgi:hypothetical protein